MKIKFLILTVLLLLPTLAIGQVTIELRSEKEITVEENGKQVVKIVPAETVEPGQVIIYTLAYTNRGNETTTNVVINDPIPESTTYVSNSASGKGSEITFSIDGGASFKKPTLLTYEINQANGNKQTRIATPEQYTHIRWTISSIASGETGEVSFRVRVN